MLNFLQRRGLVLKQRIGLPRAPAVAPPTFTLRDGVYNCVSLAFPCATGGFPSPCGKMAALAGAGCPQMP